MSRDRSIPSGDNKDSKQLNLPNLEDSLLGLNFLGFEYQRLGVIRLIDHLVSKLNPLKKELRKQSRGESVFDSLNPFKSENKEDAKSLPPLSLDEVALALQVSIPEKAKNKKNFAQAQFHLLRATMDDLMLRSVTFQQEVAENKVAENNVGLKKLIAHLIQDIERAKKIHGDLCVKYGMQNPAVMKKFDDLIKFCKQTDNYLTHAVDMQLYQVEIPHAEYQEYKKRSTTFNYEGRAASTAKTIGGGLGAGLAGAAVVAEIIFLPALIADLTMTEGVIFRGLVEATKGGAETAAEGVKRFGYSNKQDLPAEWIVGQLSVADEKAVVTQRNPHYQSAEAGQTVTVYALDGRPAAMVFEKGIAYDCGTKRNPHGHILYFHQFEHAVRCTALRIDGLQYDPLGGHRKYKDWTDEEREEVHFYMMRYLEEVQRTTGLPGPLTSLIGQYLAPERKIEQRHNLFLTPPENFSVKLKSMRSRLDLAIKGLANSEAGSEGARNYKQALYDKEVLTFLESLIDDKKEDVSRLRMVEYILQRFPETSQYMRKFLVEFREAEPATRSAPATTKLEKKARR
jgi:hypothetical protein